MPRRRSSQSGAGKDESTAFSAIQQNFILYLYLHDIVGDDAGKELNRYLGASWFQNFQERARAYAAGDTKPNCRNQGVQPHARRSHYSCRDPQATIIDSQLGKLPEKSDREPG